MEGFELKKIISLLMLAVLALVCTACGGQEGTSGSSSSAQKASSGQTAGKTGGTTGKDTLVVYFSCTGHTKGLAQDVAEICDADIFEIQPEQPYTKADLNYKDESTRATVEQKDPKARPAIKNRLENLGQYKNVVLAYPIWWGQAPRIMDTFMESYDFTGKNILPLCTSEGREIGSSADVLKQHASTAKWKEGRAFPGGLTKSDLKAALQKAQFIQ